MNRFNRALFILVSLFILIPFQCAYGETLEEHLNNLVGPKKQYNTQLSPVYLKSNYMEEYINPRSGELTLTQTDYFLPGRNGLDLEIKRIYKSGISNVQEMKAKYVNGAWVDYVEYDTKTSSFYEDRYNLGIGMRFSFPTIEIRENKDNSSHMFLHTESGDIYNLKSVMMDNKKTYLPAGQTIKDVYIRESKDFTNGQSDGTSKYVMTGKDGKKTYFAKDGRILGIVDRYGNTIQFQYTTLTYKIDGTTISKRLISKIIDTLGRTVTIQYTDDATYTVGGIKQNNYGLDESYKASQNPNTNNSGDLKGKFRVKIKLPTGKEIVYDKTAVLVSKSKHVIRTRIQRVYDIDGKPKYHYWYEQQDLGFTYKNGTNYSAYNRYENLVQIDYCKTNRIKRYTYNTYTKKLNQGSMQYRKIFETKELIKKSFDTSKSNFLNRFICDTKDKINYEYTNEADGFGTSGYKEYDENYLKKQYRYFTKIIDIKGNTSKYTYNGIHELISTENKGNNHKEVITTEHDEMKLIKKKEKKIYNVKNGQVIGQPIKKIENYRYDEYGNLTNYTGPLAERDENGYPVNNEHTITYAYAYNRYHILTLKTWKQDENTTCQISYDVDYKGNIIKEKKLHMGANSEDIVTNYIYDDYGNMIRQTIHSPDNTYVTHYVYGTDVNGVNHKGAYLTKEYSILDGKEIAQKYAYDFNTGNIKSEIDANGNRTDYTYDIFDRLIKITHPDNTTEVYDYKEYPTANKQIEYTDAKAIKYLSEYDILGDRVKYSVWKNDQWQMLRENEYDSKGNKTKEINSNGHFTGFEYDSSYRIIKKSYFHKDNDKVPKESITLSYTVGADSNTPLLVTTTDEDGYQKKYHYDIENRLIKLSVTPDKTKYYDTKYTYDYLGNKISSTDSRNNTTSYTYDELGRLINKTDALGNETLYTYNSLNKILTVEEPVEKVIHNSYDGLGRVKQKKTFEKSENDYVYESYTYDNVGNTLTLKRGSIISGKNRLTAEVTYKYDSMNRVTDKYNKVDDSKIRHTSYSYDANGNNTEEIQYVTKEKDSYIQKKYDYDYKGRPIQEEIVYKAKNEKGEIVEKGYKLKKLTLDDEGNIIKKEEYNGTDFDVSTYTYNHRNRILEKIQPYKTDGTTKKTLYKYDKRGNLQSKAIIIQGIESKTTYIYDGMGNLSSETDPLNNTTRYLYDECGNLAKEIDPRYYAENAHGAPGIIHEYDALNRRIKSIAFDGSKKEVISFKEYDGRGNIIKEGNGEGYNSQNPSSSIGNIYEYDAMDNVITYISAQTAKDNGATGCYTKKMTYDADGKALTEEDAKGNKTKYNYYLNGKLKEKIYPDGKKETYEYDITGKYFVSKTDRAGRKTIKYNNLYGKPYKIKYPDGTEESFVYDIKGRLKESIDRGGYVKYFDYDPSGNLLWKKEYVKEDQQYLYYKLTKYSYDERDSLLTSESFECKQPKQGGAEAITSAQDKVTYIYDKAGRLIKKLGPNGKETTYEYDAKGNVITNKQKVSNSTEAVKRYEYDSQSRLVAETLLVETSDLDSKQLLKAEFDNEYPSRVKATTKYTYYTNGKIKTKTDANDNKESYEYDLDNRLICKTDALNNSTIFVYDLNGNLIEEKNAKNITAYYEYDNLNRLIRKKIPYGKGDYAITRYVYDEAGNMIKEIHPNQYDAAKDNPTGVKDMNGTSYTYDVMNRRITTISPEDEIVQYIQYDKKGNIKKVVDGLRFNDSIENSAGTTCIYDGLSRVLKVTDALGNIKSYEYDILGNLKKEIDQKGNETVYDYNSDGTLAKVIYADGGTIQYEYDKLGRKTRLEDQRGNVVKYTYNGFGKIKLQKDPYNNTIEYKYDLRGNPVTIIDKRGSATYFIYDPLGRIKEKKIPIEKDKSGNVYYTIEKYGYDEVGNIIKKTITGNKNKGSKRETFYTYYDNNLIETITQNSGSYTEYSYDKNDNVIKTKTLREAEEYNIEKYEYDASNRLIKQINLVDEEDIYETDNIANIENLRDKEYSDKIQVITSFEYDILGNKIKEISPKAHMYPEDDEMNRGKYITNFTYDILNRLEKIITRHNDKDVYIQYYYDEAGNKIKERNQRGYESTYSYDKLNRIKTITDARGSTITYDYDLAGNKISDTNALGNTMKYEYDKLNRVEKIIDPYNIVISQKDYDEHGNIITEIDAKGYSRKYEYDLAHRLIAVTDPENAKTTYEYNKYGERIKETNGMGESMEYKYDSGGRLVEVIDALGVTTIYRYDKMNNKLHMTDGRGKTTSYTYGDFGQLKTVTNPEGKVITYEYDLVGNLKCMIDKKGNHWVYSYDNRNLLTEKKVIETEDKITYDYDEIGNKVKMIDESGTSEYSYDELNNLLTIKKDGEVKIAYTYDKIGNIETVTDAKGFETTYTYDKSSRMKTVSYGGKTTTYTYDKNGNRESIEYHGGVHEEYSYDKNNRLIELVNKKPNGSIISSYSYTYDKAGRQISKEDSYGTTDYTYDEVGRILKVEAPGKTTVYGYDKGSNRISQEETYTSPQPTSYIDEESGKNVEYIVKKSEYLYSSANMLMQLVEKMYNEEGEEILKKTTTYSYDDNGNQLSQSSSYIHPHTIEMRRSTKGNAIGDNINESIDKLIERTKNTFDGFNRLKKVERIKDAERSVVTYLYNGDGLRTRKESKKLSEGYTAKITNYYYDRQHVILETNEAGNIKTRYVRGINYIARYGENNDISYYLYNGHGDVVQTVAANGEVLNQYEYDIFGNPLLTVETYKNAIRYSGEFYDEETGLYYLRARYYDPYIGRFISEDSYWGEDINPLSLNLYTYAYNNPIKYVDPSGHFPSIIGSVIKKGVKKVVKYSKDIAKKIRKGMRRRRNRSSDRDSRSTSSNNNNSSSNSNRQREVERININIESAKHAYEGGYISRKEYEDNVALNLGHKADLTGDYSKAVWNNYGEVIGWNVDGPGYTDRSKEAKDIHGGGSKAKRAYRPKSLEGKLYEYVAENSQEDEEYGVGGDPTYEMEIGIRKMIAEKTGVEVDLYDPSLKKQLATEKEILQSFGIGYGFSDEFKQEVIKDYYNGTIKGKNDFFKKIRNPNFQDAEILTESDLRVMLALKYTYNVYAVQENKTDEMNTILRAMDALRGKEQYKGKYDLKNDSGEYISMYHYHNKKIISDIFVTDENAARADWLVNGTLTAAGLAPFPYNALATGASIGTTDRFSEPKTFTNLTVSDWVDIGLTIGSSRGPGKIAKKYNAAGVLKGGYGTFKSHWEKKDLTNVHITVKTGNEYKDHIYQFNPDLELEKVGSIDRNIYAPQSRFKAWENMTKDPDIWFQHSGGGEKFYFDD